MKKLVSLISAIAMFAAVSGAVTAADNNPEVYVNNAKIFFADQEATIVDDRTLVPARGVFEAMGAEVEWDGDARVVTIESGDHKVVIKLTIDDNTMRVYDIVGMFASVFEGDGTTAKAPETAVELDVAPQIINDRTMIPLRAISEAVGAKVDWNQEEYKVEITTTDAPTEAQAETLPTYYLTTSADKVNEGETVDVFVNIKNLPEDRYVAGIMATIKYNKENFTFEEATLVNGDATVQSAVQADNSDYDDESLRVVYATIDAENAAKTDGEILKLTFKSVNGKEGTFEISNSYSTIGGYNTTFLAGVGDTTSTVAYEGVELNIDTTPVVVNGEAAPEATAEPEASAAPEATEAPEASAEPETTEAPAETAEPEATAAPEATEAPAATAE